MALKTIDEVYDIEDFVSEGDFGLHDKHDGDAVDALTPCMFRH